MLTFYSVPVFDLPDGPKNLATIFPSVDWSQVASYSVQLKDDTDAILLQTPVIELGCCCSPERVRIHFRNALGRFDAVNFNSPHILHENSSSEYRKMLSGTLQKTDTGIERFNIRANETYECMTDCYREEDQDWLMELADSGKAFMEWTGIQGQSDSYLPIRILDGKYDKKKNENEWLYQFRVQFKLANDKILQR